MRHCFLTVSRHGSCPAPFAAAARLPSLSAVPAAAAVRMASNGVVVCARSPVVRREATYGGADAGEENQMPSSVRDLRPLCPPAPGQRALVLIPIALLLLLTLPAAAGAQVLYGSLVGNVSDDTGAAVPGATVTIRNKGTGTSRDTTTDATGAYRFDTVQPGMYSVTVQLTGFRTFTRARHPGHLEYDGPRRRQAAGRPAHRIGDGLRRDGPAANGPRRNALRAEGRRPRQPAGVDEPQLPVPVPRAARVHAAGGGALGAVQSLARARVQRQRREPQLEQHPHRRRQHDQRLAAARRRLRSGAGIAGSRQRRHQQLRR